jgi:hypothetical protein
MSETKIQISEKYDSTHESFDNSTIGDLNYFDLYSKIDLSKYESKILEKKREESISKSRLITPTKSHLTTPHNSPAFGPTKVKYDEPITVKCVKLNI